MKVIIREYPDGQARFQFMGANHEPQDVSEPYSSTDGAKRGAHDLARNVAGHDVDLTFEVVQAVA